MHALDPNLSKLLNNITLLYGIMLNVKLSTIAPSVLILDPSPYSHKSPSAHLTREL